MTSGRPVGGVALDTHSLLPVSSLKAEARRPAETPVHGGDIAVLTVSDATNGSTTSRKMASFTPCNASSQSTTASATLAAAGPSSASLQRHSSFEGDDGASQSHLRSTANSQDTNMTIATDNAFTPPASDASGSGPGGVDKSSQESQLMQLSQIAATQDKMTTDGWSSRKRMADGEVKTRSGSHSPLKGHSRNTSTVSKASTAGTYIGELSAELRTRLSYAMVKVNHGWQCNSLEEVESLASQAASPTSSNSTVHRRHGSSASPRLPMSAPSSQVTVSHSPFHHRRKSNSPPRISSNKPVLAPPAPIQPSLNMPAPRSNPRRNSNPHYTPTLLSHSHSASPHTPAQRSNLQPGARSLAVADPILYSPHQNMREQDAIESLLFMSSPGNSANLKHTFSPSGSPGPQSAAARSIPARHALPSGPRKALPSQRPAHPNKRGAFDKSPGMLPPGSPMDLDSPQHPYQTPNRGNPRRRINGGSSHLRGALSLPSGLGVGNGTSRRIIRDEDIERMLDRAGAEGVDSSDDEEIQIPQPRGGVAGVMQV
ncbi:Fc.00g084230.m01.CDS01 [Cosmosporella sp. VM-42]